jgi:Tfp pilus tip-associated adhesin PilY1
VGGTANNSLAAAPLAGGLTDGQAYAKMGETWSLPAVASVNPTSNITVRTPTGAPFVVYVGSGYSLNASEGTTLFTLDSMTGDVIAAADVEAAATALGLGHAVVAAPGVPSWRNSLVAGPSVYSASQLVAGQNNHPAERATRVYIGDLHGRMWKFLSVRPDKALLVADLGPGQPIGTSAALLAIRATRRSRGPTCTSPRATTRAPRRRS